MLLCMRTSVDINAELLRRAKKRAADEGTALRQIIEAALRLYLSEPPASRKQNKLHWRTERGRIQAGVRLDDRDALFDLMAGRR